MKYYFDRTTPLFIQPEPTFDGYEVQMDGDIAQFLLELRDIFESVNRKANDTGAPEDHVQEWAEELEARIKDTYYVRSRNGQTA